MKIKISQSSANKLMALYRELDNVPDNAFDQDRCSSCVIGHGIRAGVLNGFTKPNYQFNKAIRWIGLPILIQNYLFETQFQIKDLIEGGFKINGVVMKNKGYTPESAQKRIKAVLEATGYELVYE